MKMEFKKVVVPLVLAILLIGAVAAIVMAQNNDAPTEKDIVDARGRTVTIPAQVDKVVCLSAGSVRLVSYVAGVDKIVGVDSMDSGAKGSPANYFFATYRCAYNIKSLTDVGSEENQKAIIESGAQVIITSKEDTGVLDTLQEQTGIPVVAVNAEGRITIKDHAFRQNIRIVAKVMGEEQRGEALIDGIDAMLSELEDYADDVKDKYTCYVGGMFYMMKGDLTMTTGKYLPFDLVSAINAMPDTNNGNPYQTDIKGIVDSEAEFMFVDCMTNAASKAMFEENKETLSALEAVENDEIYSLLAYKYYGTNWESELYNAYYLGSVLYGDIFDYDVKEKINSVLELFYPDTGLDYDKLADYQKPGTVKLDW